MFVVGGVWAVGVVLLARTLSANVQPRPRRHALVLLMFLVILPAPLIDEYIGKSQFERLCEEYQHVQVNRGAVRSDIAYFDPRPSMTPQGTVLRVVILPHVYVEPTTGETILSYTTLTSSGGFVARMLGITQGLPLTFKGTCGPVEQPFGLLKTLGVKVVDRPKAE